MLNALRPPGETATHPPVCYCLTGLRSLTWLEVELEKLAILESLFESRQVVSLLEPQGRYRN